MPGLLSTAGLFVVVLSAFVGYIYLYGLPSATKRQISDAAVNAMGESKSTDMVKDALRKIPDSDHNNLKDVKDTQGGATNGSVQNFFDDVAGETADKIAPSDKGRGAGTVPTGV